MPVNNPPPAVAGGAGVASKSLIVSDPGGAEVDTPGFFTDVELTIKQLNAVLVGSAGQSVTWTLMYDPDRTPGAGTEVITGGKVTTSILGGDTITVFDNAVIPADSWVWLETSAQAGTVGVLTVTVTPA